MKKLITLLTSFTILSLPAVSIISCDNQTKDKNSSQLLNNTSKKQTKDSDEKINSMSNEKDNVKKDDIKTNDSNAENKKTDISINSSDNETDEFDAFKKPKDEFNNEINDNKNNGINTSNDHKTNNENLTSNQGTNSNNDGDKNNNDKNNLNIDQENIKEKTEVEKLNQEDPQYLKLINFIEMISNSTKQLLVDDKYNRLPKYKELIKINFWEFFWKSFKTELLKVNTTNKKLYNEIFDDAILQTTNSNANECTYILKSNNFISFTFGYDKRNLNFYFASQHPKYGKIDSKTDNNIFKKKYEPVYCTITSEDNVDLF